jgi:NADH-quinone oxidoreductase subunit N
LAAQQDYQGTLFNGYLMLSPALVGLKALMVMVVLLAVLLFAYGKEEGKDFSKGEFHFFILSMLLGASFLSMSASFLTLILAMELLSLSAYALTGFRSSAAASGQALRYFLLGAVATAIMLYGVSFLYGFTGTLQWSSSEFWEGLRFIPDTAVGLFFGLFLVGFLFKLAAAPFHFWVTGVYKAAPWPAVVLFALLPKIASLALLQQFSAYWQPLQGFLIPLLSGLILLSLLVGNFAALREKDARVLMAWASVGQAGFLLSFLLLDPLGGITGLYFYLAVYAIGVLGAFWLIERVKAIKGSFTLESWSHGPPLPALYGVLSVVFMVSLIGIPPLAGFTAKFFLFAGLAEAYTASSEPWLLAVLLFGVLSTAVSAFYYLKIPFYLLVATKEKPEETTYTTPRFWSFLLPALLGLLLLMVFLKPSLLTLALNSLTFTLP